MYIMSHDKESSSAADKYIRRQRAVTRPIHLNRTVYFESIMYKDYFMPYVDSWMQYDYVITGTYKTISRRYQSAEEVRRLLRVAIEGNYDVVPFSRSASLNMPRSVRLHGEAFDTAWVTLLLYMGYSTHEISAARRMKVFFRNIYIIKSNVLEGLVKFMVRAIDTAERYPSVQKLLAADAHYNDGDASVALSVFNTTYYQLYPFVYERLPCFYLFHVNASVCQFDKGPCEHNSP
jgi:hypothetical protein